MIVSVPGAAASPTVQLAEGVHADPATGVVPIRIRDTLQ
jgi:hypothetical protein